MSKSATPKKEKPTRKSSASKAKRPQKEIAETAEIGAKDSLRKRSTGGKAIPALEREAIVVHILEEVANTEKSVHSICRDDGRITDRCFQKWLHEDVDLVRRYARAQEQRTELMGEKLLEIADDGSNDTYTDEEGNERVKHDVIARSKLRVDTRKWLMSKLAPKKYGDKAAVELSGEVKTNGAITAPEELVAYVHSALPGFLSALQKKPE